MKRPGPLPSRSSSPGDGDDLSPSSDVRDEAEAVARRQETLRRLEEESGRRAVPAIGATPDLDSTEPIDLPPGTPAKKRRSRLHDRSKRVAAAVRQSVVGVETDSVPVVDVVPTGADDAATDGSWSAVWRATRARRKALRAEVRRFTVRGRRRRLMWLAGISAVLLVVVASLGVSYSPIFAVQAIVVEGETTLSEADVQQALSSQVGVPLGLVDETAVAQALAPFAQIETYSLEARPPHELVVRVTERTAIGVVAREDGFDTVDAAGVVLGSSPENPGLPVIEARGGVDSEAFAAIGTVLRALPDDIRAMVGAATANGAEDVTLTLAESGATVIWGSADESVEKSDVLRSALTALPPGDVSTYDVSAPSTLVVG